MADPLLITPDHRLLGWGVTDLTLYGAQPLPGMAIGPARDLDAEALRSTALAGGERPGAAPADARLAAPANDAALVESVAPTALFTPAATITSPASLLHAPDPAPALGHAPEQPSVPQPIGSGSFVQPPLATPLQATEAPHGDGAFPAASPAAAAEIAPVASPGSPAADSAIAATVGALATLTAAADPLTHGTLAMSPLAPDVMVTARDLSMTVDAAAHAVEADTIDAIAHSSPALPEAIAAPISDVAHELAALPEAIDAPVADVAHAAGALPDALAAPAAPATETALTGFGGSDPAAGISTLVGMVDSVDAFHLDHALTPVAAATPAPSILDALAADDHAPALLGDAHGADHLVDDHGGIHVGL